MDTNLHPDCLHGNPGAQLPHPINPINPIHPLHLSSAAHGAHGILPGHSVDAHLFHQLGILFYR